MKENCRDPLTGVSNSNICVGEGCFGLACIRVADMGLVQTVVEPMFGRHFVVVGDYSPTFWETIFGRRKRNGNNPKGKENL